MQNIVILGMELPLLCPVQGLHQLGIAVCLQSVEVAHSLVQGLHQLSIVQCVSNLLRWLTLLSKVCTSSALLHVGCHGDLRSCSSMATSHLDIVMGTHMLEIMTRNCIIPLHYSNGHTSIKTSTCTRGRYLSKES